jgi:hypothetical protein
MRKKLLAAILGGLAFFAWSSVAHLVLPLGRTGVSEMPNEQQVATALKANITEDGLYFFPGLGLPATASRSERMASMKALAAKIEAGPSGIMVIHPHGAKPLSASQLLTELGTNIVQVFVAILLLGYTSLATFGARWRFLALVGIVAGISTNISYWNFYGFPGNYTAVYVLNIVVGFAVAGLVAAAMVKPASSRASAATA